MIVTAGAIDCHVHFICPQIAYEAISSGELQGNIFCCHYMEDSKVAHTVINISKYVDAFTLQFEISTSAFA